jgi:hypothetical protein
MKWGISIFSADGKQLIFAAQTSRAEAEALATEARHHDRHLQIFLRSPQGQVSIWP